MPCSDVYSGHERHGVLDGGERPGIATRQHAAALQGGQLLQPQPRLQEDTWGHLPRGAGLRVWAAAHTLPAIVSLTDIFVIQAVHRIPTTRPAHTSCFLFTVFSVSPSVSVGSPDVERPQVRTISGKNLWGIKAPYSYWNRLLTFEPCGGGWGRYWQATALPLQQGCWRGSI